jgi:hypothetical protein
MAVEAGFKENVDEEKFVKASLALVTYVTSL